MKMTRWGSAARVGLLALTAATAAHANFLFTDPGSHPSRFGDGFSLGSRFTDITPGTLTVTALGIYDFNGGGFFQSHDVGLWDVTQGNTEVAQVTIPAGSGAFSLNGFRYIDLISPVDLVDGDQYILAAFYPVGQVLGVNDQMLNCCTSGSNASTDPSFGSFSAAFSATGLGSSVGHLTEPNGFTAGTDYVGPNLLFITPEPGSAVLLILGVGTLALRRKRIRG
jgi:hypothetical protein